jgi:hypothetical protein
MNDLTFYSIEPVNDGGNALHMEWEQSQLNARYPHNIPSMKRAADPNSDNGQQKHPASHVNLDLAEEASSTRFSKLSEMKAVGPSDVGSATDLAYTELWTDSGYASLSKDTAPTSVRNSTSKQQPDGFNSQLYDLHEDDASTVYSVAESVPENDLETYKSELSEAILNVVRPHASNPEQLESLKSLLPALLQSFALRLGYPDSSKEEREIMYFVHRHRQFVSPLLTPPPKLMIP